jgi:DDE superfamily endonuclease
VDSESIVRRSGARLGSVFLTAEKRSTVASERDERLRLAWRSVVGGLDSRSLVFVDEMGAHTSLAPLYGYSPRGQRAFFEIPRNRGTNTTLLSSMSLEGMGPSMAIEGSTTKEVFEAYIEHFLASTLRAGQVVVMDNLSAHKGERVRKLIEERLRTALLAALFARSEPYRMGVLEGQEIAEGHWPPYERGVGGSHR